MRTVAGFMFVILALFAQLASAKLSCDGSLESRDPRKAGRITYEISPDQCVSDDEKQTCIMQIEVERDWCKDADVVMKVVCEKNEPKTLEMKCPTGTKCRGGACR